MPVPTLAAIGAATDIASTIFNPISTFMTNKQNLKIANANRNFSYQMWQKNNEYNTPEAQKQRLIDAGYNPNMFEASSNTSAAPAQTIDMPEIQAPQLDNQAGGRVFQNYMQALMQKQQIAGMKADIQKSNAEADYYRSMTNRNDMLLPLEAKKLSADIEHTVAQKEFVVKNRDWIDKLNQNKIDLNDATIKEIKSHIKLMASQAGLNEAQAQYVTQQAIYQLAYNQYFQQHGFTVDAAWQTKVGNVIVNLIDKLRDMQPSFSLFPERPEIPPSSGAGGGSW
ncbi:minor capsid protein [Microvirus sp.]|nr:minor capsid protein [Microvirus sp.]